MKTKKILGIAGTVLAAALLGGCIYLNTLMPIITGYAAKNLASAVFASCGPKKQSPKVLVLYYSQTSNTAAVAQEIQKALGADGEEPVFTQVVR